MVSIKLTVIGIERIATPIKRKYIYEKEVPGLVLCVHLTGTKVGAFHTKFKIKLIDYGYPERPYRLNYAEWKRKKFFVDIPF